MKKIILMVTTFLFLFSLQPVQAKEIGDNLVIEAFPYKEGTIVEKGDLKYLKYFKLVVYKTTKSPIELTNFVGCYQAVNEKGNTFDANSVQLELLGDLGKEVKEGEVSFVSKDSSIYSAKFVKWSSNCSNLAKRIEK